MGVKIGSSTLMGMICSRVIVGMKIGSSVIVHPFPKCTCSQEGNAQGKDNFPNSEIQIFLNVSKNRISKNTIISVFHIDLILWVRR